MKRALTRKIMLDIECHTLADAELSHYLLMQLRKARMVTVSGQHAVTDLIPGFDRLFWRATVKETSDSVDRLGRISTAAVMHQAVHQIFALKFGAKINTDPGLTLLAETFSTAVTFYFDLKLSETAAATAREAFDLHFKGSTVNDLNVRRKFNKQFEKFVIDPFDVYGRFAIEFWEFYKFLIHMDRKNSSEPPDVANIRAHVASMSFPWIPSRYDVIGNVLFVKANCKKLTSAELRKTESLLYHMLNATSVLESLKKIDF